jgi:PAS domain S-box-containing protein
MHGFEKEAAGTSLSRWRASARYLGSLIAVALAYYLLAKLGSRLITTHPGVSPIWPAAGLALAAVLLGGLRIWPAVFAGAFAASADTAGALAISALIALGNTLEAVIGGYLIQRWSGGRDTFKTPLPIAKFALIAALPATVISASGGIATLGVVGVIDRSEFAPLWITWWLADVAGTLLVTPVIVLWAQTNWRAFDWREARGVAGGVLFAGVVGLIAFDPLLPRFDYAGPLAFLAPLPLVWAALRRGPRDTATVALILTGFAVWATIGQAGPFGTIELKQAMPLVLTFMVSLSVPTLALSADVAVRRLTENSLLRTQAGLERHVKERTAALADANTHLMEAQRLANLGSWSWDVPTDAISWSEQLFKIYGRSPDQFKGTLQEFISFIHPDDRAQVHHSIVAALKSGTEFSHEERIVLPDGSIRHPHSVGEVIRNDSGKPVRMLGICLDVTERKQAERALQDTELNYRLLLKGARDYAIYMLDAQGRVRTWNDGAQRLKGYAADEIIGQPFSIFLPKEVQPDEMAQQALAAAARAGQFEAQTWLVRKDGSRFYASVVMDAIRNDAGELIGFAKLVRDVTAQHEAQLAIEQAREQLAQAQKMEALGQLTGGIAHDFNNLLMIVSGYAQILRSRLREAKDVQAVEAIRAAANHGEKLTRQLLAFSRRQQLVPVVVDLHQHIDAVRNMLVPSLRGNIELICDIEDKIWPVEVDLGELELALVNIAVNARDAMPDGGTITLSARNVVLKPGSAAGSLAGEFVALAIIDSGSGMPAEVLHRVFEPFFTTKPIGKGTGLGLSQVHGFASQSGGAVTVNSEVGHGTVVTIYLPRSALAPAAEAGEGAAVSGDQTHGTVLLVEDSRAVAEVTTSLLEQLGYRVVRAENAAEALRHLQQGIGVDLLFSDIVMPGAINGIGLAQICQERFPELPVVLTTGFSDAAEAAAGRFEILRKPFELATLERAIDSAILHGSAHGRSAQAS